MNAIGITGQIKKQLIRQYKNLEDYAQKCRVYVSNFYREAPMPDKNYFQELLFQFSCHIDRKEILENTEDLLKLILLMGQNKAMFTECANDNLLSCFFQAIMKLAISIEQLREENAQITIIQQLTSATGTKQ